MRSFFKIFFASLLSLIVFCLIGFFVLVALAGSLSQKEKERIDSKTVLMLDLSQHFSEQEENDPLSEITGDDNTPGLYDAVRIIRHANSHLVTFFLPLVC